VPGTERQSSSAKPEVACTWGARTSARSARAGR